MFPEYTELRSLDSTKREIIINTDNWPEMRKLITSKSQNPQDKHFDWAFWCGILNNKDYNIRCWNESNKSLPFNSTLLRFS